MMAKGLSYAEIALELQVSRTSISSDVQYLREQAKESIKEETREITINQVFLNKIIAASARSDFVLAAAVPFQGANIPSNTTISSHQ